jgi:hypothetical protein
LIGRRHQQLHLIVAIRERAAARAKASGKPPAEYLGTVARETLTELKQNCCLRFRP